MTTAVSMTRFPTYAEPHQPESITAESVAMCYSRKRRQADDYRMQAGLLRRAGDVQGANEVEGWATRLEDEIADGVRCFDPANAPPLRKAVQHGAA
jgi:hypothetical protein